MSAAVREWEESDSGLVFPGARLGHTSRVRPSQGGRRYEAFVGKHVRQSKGRWRGQPLSFYDEQRGFHHELLRTEAGRRLYSQALYGVPRKNGKSTDAAALALYLLTADGEPAPEVYGAAGSREQARAVFTEAQRMVKASPVLNEWCKVQRNEIIVPSIDGVYRVVSAEGGLQMGTNPSAVVADELHVWKGDAGRELYYALATGMDARSDPLFVMITTAGYERDSIAYEVFERGLSGEPGFLMYWLGATEGEALDDPAVWMRANPAPWITEERLARAYHRLPPAVFARLHLNLWTQTQNLWLPVEAWNACKGRERLELGERVWIGVDIGLRHDTSAVATVALRRDPATGKRKYVVKVRIFDPAEHDGRLDLSPVENYIRDEAKRYRVVEVRYDPAFFHRSAEDLSDAIRMTEVPFNNARIVPASQLVYDAVVDRELVHDGDAALAKQVLSAAVRETERGWRVSKSKSQGRIDALTAILLAMSGTSEARGAEPGARPIGVTSDPADEQRSDRADAGRTIALRTRAERAVHEGRVVECTADEYRDVIRGALQDYAGRMIDHGQDVRAVIALNEVKRLDGKHG